MKKIALIQIFLFSFVLLFGQNMDLSVTGDVNFDNSTYSINEAGEDFTSLLSPESSAYISIDYINFMDAIWGSDIKWRIFVSKTDILWHQNLTLEIKRNGKGNKASWFGPSPTVNHGTSYRVITNNPVYFFRGRYGSTNIPLGFRINGASLSMGASQFETTITFTMYDDW